MPGPQTEGLNINGNPITLVMLSASHSSHGESIRQIRAQYSQPWMLGRWVLQRGALHELVNMQGVVENTLSRELRTVLSPLHPAQCFHLLLELYVDIDAHQNLGPGCLVAHASPKQIPKD